MNYSHCKDCTVKKTCGLVSYDVEDDECAYEILADIRTKNQLEVSACDV